jgi:putative membrane protein
MAIADAKRRARHNTRGVTIGLSVAAYVVVLGSFGGFFPYPDISRSTVNLLSHGIAVVNTLALLALVAGWRWIRAGDVRKHRAAMLSATVLIGIFLVMYLVKIGGGGEKEIVGTTGFVYYAYIGMLAVHILLSVLAVPLVIYALVLGLTHSPSELRDTIHPRIGRVAAATWILSLALGVITYVLLNHVYSYRFMEMAFLGV